MTQQQEMWYRRNLARRQAMVAAVVRMAYLAAGGSSSGSSSNSFVPADEGITVPPIPAPEEMMFYFSDGTVSSTAELDEWASGATEDEIDAKINDIGKVVIGADMIEGLNYSLPLDQTSYPNLSSIVIPDGVLSVSLREKNFRELTIPNTTTDIFIDAASSGLEILNIGSGVSCLYDDDNGFRVILPEDRGLDIRISKDNQTYKTQNGFILTKDGSEAVVYFGNAESVTIPDGVKSIGCDAFCDYAGLANVTIPDSVETIGNAAFADCGALTGVTIPDGVTNIGNQTFEGCTGLESVTIGNGVESVGNGAFQDCSQLMDIYWTSKTKEYVLGLSINKWGLDSDCRIHCSDGEITAGEANIEVIA